jgi:hypothetical protein
MQLFAGQPQLAREAGGRLALRDAAQQQDQGRWPLPGFREDRRGQQGVITIAGATPVGWKVALRAEQASWGVPTARADQPIGMEITFQPEETDAVVQEFGDWKVDHAVMVPHPARWLHMSQSCFDWAAEIWANFLQ